MRQGQSLNCTPRHVRTNRQQEQESRQRFLRLATLNITSIISPLACAPGRLWAATGEHVQCGTSQQNQLEGIQQNRYRLKGIQQNISKANSRNQGKQQTDHGQQSAVNRHSHSAKHRQVITTEGSFIRNHPRTSRHQSSSRSGGVLHQP